MLQILPTGVLPTGVLPTGDIDWTYNPAGGGAVVFAGLLIGIPLASALLLLVLGRVSDKWGHWFATLASWASFALGLAIFSQILGYEGEARNVSVPLWDFIPGSDVSVKLGLLVDPLSLTFVMLVTFVGSLIHVYSVAYMEHDADRRRFFAYLNLFVASMLMLVLGNSFLALFIGWEGVGLASYLLIGFWNHVPEYAAAAKKAFVMNRVGDLGLLLAMMAMFASVGSVSFEKVLFTELDQWQATFIGLFLLLAACGKSAQFPLQAWLGDAMAGPTPVSALIHAATMVTAGVYLMVRSGPVFVQTPVASLMVVIVGAITLLFGAIVGCAKDDMKKVLAASTMSQIGYMMLGAGLGPVGWAFAIFHLLTHGFFKAQLFLGAGAVMHAMGDQVNIRRFGGLAGAMKITFVTFGIGWLAILGIPPFSGFFSKDKIIEAAFMPREGFGNWYPWVFGLVALIGAGITAFYMSRLFFLIFLGKARWTTKAESREVHPHEASPLMTVPLIVLSVFSVGLGGFLTVNDAFVTWLEPSIGETAHHHPVLPIPVIMAATLGVVLAGAALAWMLFIKRPVDTAVPEAGALVTAARNDLYQDQINKAAFIVPTGALVKGVGVTDSKVIDGIVEGAGAGSLGLGKLIGKAHTGNVRSYAGLTLLGSVLAVVIVLATRI
ncbi:MAG: NADH-quinone oxidoreductase subunit L [Actinomycetaceae bacterium]|nr:NADH-quinone oxidoreductase subunit L [Actinomycetaceae bacterium]